MLHHPEGLGAFQKQQICRVALAFAIGHLLTVRHVRHSMDVVQLRTVGIDLVRMCEVVYLPCMLLAVVIFVRLDLKADSQG